MRTEYVRTNFATITEQCRKAYAIKGRARGVNLVPLALGEEPPETTPALEDIAERQIEHGINFATADQLEEVCGIGPELATAIVAHRSTYGDFEQASDLEVIPGIGKATAGKIWDAI